MQNTMAVLLCPARRNFKRREKSTLKWVWGDQDAQYIGTLHHAMPNT